MSIEEILLKGGGLLMLLMTIVQISPIKINPWSFLAKVLGNAFNKGVIDELDEVKDSVKKTQETLDAHIQIDDERNADGHRQRILQFNNELLRGIPHTKEDFNEILEEMDFYETYCKAHPEYKNNRAVHAIAHIGKVYDERLEKHDFL